MAGRDKWSDINIKGVDPFFFFFLFFSRSILLLILEDGQEFVLLVS